MGWLTGRDVNTISDKDYKALQDRAHRANPDSFTAKVVKQRLASREQRLKRKSS